MPVDPVSLGQFKHLSAFETAFWRKVQVLNGGLQRETGGLDATTSAVIGPASYFDINQQAKTFFKRQLGILRILILLFESAAEAG